MRKGLENIKDINRRRYLELVLHEVMQEFGESLTSFVVYGSVARGDEYKCSDTDVLLILNSDEAYSERCEKLATVLAKVYKHKLTLELVEKGYNVFIEFYPLNLSEALQFRPIYLDMIEDAVILYDKGIFEELMSRLLNLLNRLGSKRIWICEKSWFWMLKPDIKFGEVINYEL